MATTLRKNHNRILQGTLLMSPSNRRVNVRYELEQEVQYVMHNSNKQYFKGIIINISDAGIDMFVFTPLQEGKEIIITSDDNRLNRRANVRWCREVGDNIYKVGLLFIVR